MAKTIYFSVNVDYEEPYNNEYFCKCPHCQHQNIFWDYQITHIKGSYKKVVQCEFCGKFISAMIPNE